MGDMTSALPPILPSPPIYAGDTAVWPSYTFKDSVGAVIDLVAAGWTNWESQWRPTPADDTVLALTVDDSGASSGVILISASSEVTEAMGGRGYWDLQATNGTVVQTWGRGQTEYVQDVTRDA